MKFNSLPLAAAVMTFLFSRCACECDSVATSISGMETLVDIEKELLSIFERYIESNENKINVLKR